MKKKIITKSGKETFALAKKYSLNLLGGEVLALFGDLGSGKTVFTQGLACGLGLKQNVPSPTFVVMRVYTTNQSKIKTFCHIDAYRLNSSKELIEIGVQDYLGKKNIITVIEWPEKALNLIPFQKIKKIKFHHISQSERLIEFD